MNNGWHIGHAPSDSRDTRGWFLGGFFSAEDPRRSDDTEVKWGIHEAGDSRDDWAPGTETSTLTVLVGGGPFTVSCRSDDGATDTARLTFAGDYVLFKPGVEHTWHAEGDTTMLTVRWIDTRAL